MSSEYIQAGKAVSAIHSGKSGIKNAIFDVAGKVRNVKRIYALVTETVKRRKEIQNAISCIPALKHADVDKGMLQVLIYELLWGAGKIKGGGTIKRLIVDNEDALRKISGRPKEAKPFAKLKTDGDLFFSDGASSDRGRWVRVNTLVSSPEEVMEMLTDANLSSTKQALDAKNIKMHPDLPYMFYLPPGSHSLLNLHDHPLVTKGSIILQDLPSALPAHALLGEVLYPQSAAFSSSSKSKDTSASPSVAVTSWREFLQTSLNEVGATTATKASKSNKSKGKSSNASFDVIDACAAPGNKTSQLAALLQTALKDVSPTNNPRVNVFAFDRDNTRLNLLSDRMEQASANTIVTATCADFLSVDVNDPKYANVRAVLVDPSCSGSGMRAVWEAASSSSNKTNDTKEEQEVGIKRQRADVECKFEKPIDGKDNTSKQSISNEQAMKSADSYVPPVVPERELKRVTTLADFQTNAVLHALSFPNVKRVVYSTCSLYEEENEGVVSRILAQYSGNSSGGDGPDTNTGKSTSASCKVRLVPALPSWPLRGCVLSGLTKEQATCCLRWDPVSKIDSRVYGDLYLGETGFFVALFEKY